MRAMAGIVFTDQPMAQSWAARKEMHSHAIVIFEDKSMILEVFQVGLKGKQRQHWQKSLSRAHPRHSDEILDGATQLQDIAEIQAYAWSYY